MSIYMGNGKVTGMFVNHNGVKKEIQSGWINQNGIAVPIYRKKQEEGNAAFCIIPFNTINMPYVYYSGDLSNWNKSDLSSCLNSETLSNVRFLDITYYKGKWYILGDYNNYNAFLLQSSDAIHWKNIYTWSLSIYSVLARLIVVDDYLCVCGNNGQLYYTDDLITFTLRTSGYARSINVYISDIKKNSSYYYLVQGRGYSVYAQTFPDFGTTYMSGVTSNDSAYDFYSLCLDESIDTMFAGCLYNAYRTAGTSWTSMAKGQSPSSGTVIVSLAKNMDRMIGIKYTGQLFYKNIGSVSWSNAVVNMVKETGASVSPSIPCPFNIVRGNGKFVVFLNKSVCSSEDGIEWSIGSPDIFSDISQGKIAFSNHGGTDESS